MFRKPSNLLKSIWSLRLDEVGWTKLLKENGKRLAATANGGDFLGITLQQPLKKVEAQLHGDLSV